MQIKPKPFTPLYSLVEFLRPSSSKSTKSLSQSRFLLPTQFQAHQLFTKPKRRAVCTTQTRLTTHFEFSQNFWIWRTVRFLVSGCSLKSDTMRSQQARTSACLCDENELRLCLMSMICWCSLKAMNSKRFSRSENRFSFLYVAEAASAAAASESSCLFAADVVVVEDVRATFCFDSDFALGLSGVGIL